MTEFNDKIANKDFVLNENKIKEYINSMNVDFVKELIFLDETTSTFDETNALTCKNGGVVCTRKQTGGRGRLGRKWISENGGIYFSILLSAKDGCDNLQKITSVCALGVLEALKKYTPCKIKWPNDIISDNGKKLCGILTKLKTENDMISYLDVGIGINANMTEFPSELKYASSLRIILKEYIDENRLFTEVLDKIGKYVQGNIDDSMKLYAKECINVGRAVRALNPNGEEKYKGICTKINDDGSLKIKTYSGKEIDVCSGEFSVRGIYGEDYV